MSNVLDANDDNVQNILIFLDLGETLIYIYIYTITINNIITDKITLKHCLFVWSTIAVFYFIFGVNPKILNSFLCPG